MIRDLVFMKLSMVELEPRHALLMLAEPFRRYGETRGALGRGAGT